MNYLSVFLTVSLVHLLAVISPGPDFLLITRNSLSYSRKTAIYSALGLALGITIHVTYCLIGIGLLISKSIVLFSLIKYVGAFYLIYIGYKSISSKSKEHAAKKEEVLEDILPLDAIKMGFITNVTNPKATLFFLSLFTLVITPDTPLFMKYSHNLTVGVSGFFEYYISGSIHSRAYARGFLETAIKLVMGMEMTLATFLWFTFLAIVLTHSIVKKRVAKIQTKATKFMGILLIALGIKIAFFTAK